jgi:predicted amidohydrolase YtcJ
MLSCNLEYKALTVPQFQARIQACLDAEPQAGPDDWLLVINWFELAILPTGTVLDHGALDALHTSRPIVVHSTYGHTCLTNARGLVLAGITRGTPDPKDGVIARTPAGEPTGLLEDAAQELVDGLRPVPTAARNLEATRLALRAMREQGITSFLDASTSMATLESYTTLQQRGELTARGHFAVLVDSAPGFDAARAVAEVLDTRRRYDQGPLQSAAGISVDTAKLFLDGVYNTPAFTSFLLQPYFENRGTAVQPDWRPGAFTGPKPYFSPAQLEQTLLLLAAAGINPHMHADADGAVREALDAVAAMRRVHPGDDIRPAIAHDEIVHPDDYPRYAQLGVLPVLSFQWEKPAADLNARDSQYLGPVRLALVEPAGLLAMHGARIVYGSDWPVDPLDEWLALQVAVTRSAVGEDAQAFPGRLGIDPGLTLRAALRAITIDAAYSLRQEQVTGSLEAGKFADFVVLDRNPLESPPDQVSSTRTLLTVVGGKVVYRAAEFPGL